MRRTQNDCPTPNTSASKDIIVFPAALYTPAMAAPKKRKERKKIIKRVFSNLASDLLISRALPTNHLLAC